MSRVLACAVVMECGRYGLPVRFRAYTGLRWGEASAPRASRLDLLRRRAPVAVTLAEVSGELVEGTAGGGVVDLGKRRSPGR
ncbi:hypothetical protein GA0074692_4687 [Micromonospora pallida]|uniref:Uncharacterized protein n=1 Tax=Micromonospora pallida TaxID=145854 RepID=A0A1C6T6T4_9ACTN|nr:hypothetical protein [Micromonospora pallida]SCL37494.1 hypothetical protein GA0074692_4687 [Micromonospora pallida]